MVNNHACFEHSFINSLFYTNVFCGIFQMNLTLIHSYIAASSEEFCVLGETLHSDLQGLMWGQNLLDKSLFLYSRPKQVRLPLLHSKYHQKSHKALQPTSSATFNYGSETQRIVCSIPSLQRQQRKKTCVFVTHV
mgnify:CR=1 FL=1